MTNPNISQLHLRQAEQIARYLADPESGALARRHLKPAFSGFYLTELNSMTFLVAALDTSAIGDQRRYEGDVPHQISTELSHRAGRRIPIYLSNTTGLRYVALLSALPRMPSRIDLPPAPLLSGRVGLGQGFNGKLIVESWESLGHVLVSGITRSGKSALLRSLIFQALRDGLQIAISDLDRVSFRMLANHPQLFAPIATSPEETQNLIGRALNECEQRAELFERMPGFPDTIAEYNALAAARGEEPLPRILLVLDEFNSTMMALGSGREETRRLLASLGMRGLKFGLTVVFAAHNFTLEQAGLLREQCATVICFQSSSVEMARRMGCQGAAQIPARAKGRCVTNRWGPLQAFFVEKELLIRAVPPQALPPAGELTASSQSPVATETERIRALAQEGQGEAAIIRALWGVSGGGAFYRRRDQVRRALGTSSSASSSTSAPVPAPL